MWNILFTLILCLTAAGNFENTSIGFKVAIVILTIIIQAMLLYQEWQQERLQERVKNLEKRLKELVGDNDETKTF